MKKFLKLFIAQALIMHGCGQHSIAALTDVDKANVLQKQLLANGGFENGKAKWTASAGTFNTTISSPMVGLVHATWDAAASADTLTHASVTIPAGMYGRNGVASCLITTASGTATHSLQVYDGSNIVASTSISSATTPARASTNFIFPSSGSLSLRLYANANEPSIAIDDCFLGPADGFNIGLASPVLPMETVTFTGSWSTNTTYVAKRGIVGDRAVFDVEIQLAGAPTSAALTLTLPTGDVIDTGKLTSSTASTTYIDGRAEIYDNAPANYTAAKLKYESTTSLSVWVMNTNNGNSNAVTQAVPVTFGSGDRLYFHFSLPLVRLQGFITTYTPDQVASSWAGYHDTTCQWTRTNTALGDPAADSTCALTETSNINFGTVTSALSGSDKLPGIVFTPKRAGRYWVCANGTQGGATGVSNGSTFARLTDGTTVVADNEHKIYNGGVSSQGMTLPLCGVYVATSTASVTLKIQIAATTSQAIYGSFNASTVRSAVEWTIFSMDQSFPAPVIANSVTTLSGVSTGVYGANVTSGGVPSETGGDWINGNCAVTDTSLYTCTLNSGACSGTTTCTTNVIDSGTSTDSTAKLSTTPSNTSVVVRTSVSSTSTNYAKSAIPFTLICTCVR